MSDIKSDFKKWLQEHFSKSTAYSYYGLVQKIFNKNFGISQDWQQYSENIIPLLVRYFEFANREYYLDRVTIWYALDYFDKILKFIYPKQNKLYKNEPDVKISIYDGQKDYPIIDTSLYNLNNYIKYIANIIYNQGHSGDLQAGDDVLKIILRLHIISKAIKHINIKDTAIHISYKFSENGTEKTALSRYCDFLYALTANPAFDYKGNPVVNMATNENPNNMIGGNYYISQPITGKQPLQITIKDPDRIYYHDENDIPDFILIVSDMVDILHIDRKSVVKHFVDKKFIKNKKPDAEKIEKEYGIAKDKTVLRTYFSISSTNDFLKNQHHSVYKKGYPVNYDKEGYADKNKKDYWIQQSKTIRELTISRNAFSDLITRYNCSYIDYIKGYPRYYDEDIQYLKTTSLIIEAQRRKRLYLRKNNKIKTN
jgi:hypothetical protein